MQLFPSPKNHYARTWCTTIVHTRSRVKSQNVSKITSPPIHRGLSILPSEWAHMMWSHVQELVKTSIIKSTCLYSMPSTTNICVYNKRCDLVNFSHISRPFTIMFQLSSFNGFTSSSGINVSLLWCIHATTIDSYTTFCDWPHNSIRLSLSMPTGCLQSCFVSAAFPVVF